MSVPNPATTDWVPLWSAGPVAGYVPAARVFHSAIQNLVNATITLVSFDSERLDTDGIHDTAINNSRLTCKTAGIYQITANIGFANAATGYRQLYLRLNGGAGVVIAEDTRPAVNGEVTYMSLTTLYALSVGDYVEVLAFQNNGATIALNPMPPYSPEFEMAYLGPNVAIGAVIPPTYGTTLPASPADGQEAVLVDSLTNPTYQWRFRYNAGSSSAYKWEFIGGGGMFGLVETIETYTTSVDGALATALQFTVPRAGDYDVSWGFNGWHSLAGGGVQMGISVGGAAVPQAQRIATSAPNVSYPQTYMRLQRITGIAASSVVATRHAVSQATGSFRDRWLQIIPVRVS